MSEITSWPGDCAVLIPSYKAAATLSTFLPRLLESVPAAHVLVVDDGSGDKTAAICASMNVACVRHDTNRGKGAALKTGFAALGARGYSWVITMDADGQHAIEDLPKFVEAIRNGPQPCLWIGKRAMRPGVMPLARICSNVLTSSALTILSGRRILDSQCGYRAYPLAATVALPLKYDRFEFESEVILRLSSRKCPIQFVSIRTVYSDAGSHISHVRDTFRWIRAVCGVWFSLPFSGRK